MAGRSRKKQKMPIFRPLPMTPLVRFFVPKTIPGAPWSYPKIWRQSSIFFQSCKWTDTHTLASLSAAVHPQMCWCVASPLVLRETKNASFLIRTYDFNFFAPKTISGAPWSYRENLETITSLISKLDASKHTYLGLHKDRHTNRINELVH